MSLSYSEATQRMIEGLLQAAHAHEGGCLEGIETSFDLLDANLPRDAGPDFDKLLIALDFWDGWIDSRNHDWRFYKGIGPEDWPRMARRIVADLQSGREITDELVLSQFDFKNRTQRPGIFRRLISALTVRRAR
jgi:hypothetical protein